MTDPVSSAAVLFGNDLVRSQWKISLLGKDFSTSENNEPEIASTFLKKTFKVYIFAHSEEQYRRICATNKMQSLFRAEMWLKVLKILYCSHQLGFFQGTIVLHQHNAERVAAPLGAGSHLGSPRGLARLRLSNCLWPKEQDKLAGES